MLIMVVLFRLLHLTFSQLLSCLTLLGRAGAGETTPSTL
jgi:hypothetical protein